MKEQRRIVISVDAIIYDKEGNVLLIKRNYEPFKYYFCLPGGIVEENELLHEAVTREVKEETGIQISFTKKDYFTYFDDINRDPRFRNITHVFVKQLPNLYKIKIGKYDNREISEVHIFNLNSLPEKMGFDHGEILAEFKKFFFKFLMPI